MRYICNLINEDYYYYYDYYYYVILQGRVNSELVDCQPVDELQLDGAERKLVSLNSITNRQ